MALVGRAERGRLGGERHLHGLPHFAKAAASRGSCSQFAPTATRPLGHRPRALGRGVPSLHWVTSGRKLIVATPATRFRRRASGDLHFGQMKERLQNQEVDAGIFEQANLFGDVVARVAEGSIPSRSTSCVRETLPATSARSPATSFASLPRRH